MSGPNFLSLSHQQKLTPVCACSRSCNRYAPYATKCKWHCYLELYITSTENPQTET